MLWLVIELFEAEFKLAIDCESPVLPCCDPLLEATVETLFEIESLFLADVELKADTLSDNDFTSVVDCDCIVDSDWLTESAIEDEVDSNSDSDSNWESALEALLSLTFVWLAESLSEFSRDVASSEELWYELDKLVEFWIDWELVHDALSLKELIVDSDRDSPWLLVLVILSLLDTEFDVATESEVDIVEELLIERDSSLDVLSTILWLLKVEFDWSVLPL